MDKALEDVKKLARADDDAPARAVLACSREIGVQRRIDGLTALAEGRPTRKLEMPKTNDIRAIVLKEIGEDIDPSDPLFAVVVASQTIDLSRLTAAIRQMKEKEGESINRAKRMARIASVSAVIAVLSVMLAIAEYVR